MFTECCPISSLWWCWPSPLRSPGAALRQRYSDQIAQLEQVSRRFRRVYGTLKVSQKYSVSHEDILAAAALAKEELLRRRDALKSLRGKR